MLTKKISRREMLQGLGLTTAGMALAACGSTPTPQVVEKVVTKEVEKEVKVEVTTVVEKEVEKVVTATPPPKEPVEIVFVTPEASDSSEKLYKPIYDKFREAHPDIKVKWLGVVPAGGDTFWSSYFDKLLILVAGGESPDMAKIPTEGGRLAAARNLTLPLDDYIAATPELDDYFQDISPKLAQVFVFGGKTYGLPYDYNNMMIWFNTKRLKEEGLDVPPEDWTFSDFLTYAQALTKKKDDQITHYGFNFWTSPFGLCPWLFNNGLEGMMGGDALDKPLMTDAATVEVIQFLYDMMYKHQVVPRPDVQAPGSFEQGTIAMDMAGRWPMSGYIENGFSDYEVQYWPKGTRRVTEVGCGSWPIFRAAKHPEAAWAFEVWLLSKESVAYMVSTGANIPSRRSVGYAEDFIKLPAKSGKLWYESIDREDIPVMSVTSPPDFSEMAQISGRYLSLVFANELGVEEGLQLCQKEMEQMVSRRPAEWAEVFK